MIVARLDKLPERAIVDGFKGVIDFYLWKGIACARKWPTWRPRESTPIEKANQDDFSYITKILAYIDPYIREQYVRMSVGTRFTWRDLAIRGYMSGIRY